MKRSDELRQKVAAVVAQNIQDAGHYFKRTFDMPTILFTKKGGVAGTATPSDWKVNFNAQLLNENEEDFLARTVPHEVAHLITAKMYPQTMSRDWGRKRDWHGPNFRFVLGTVLGCDDTTRCHSYNTSTTGKRKIRFQYQCGCGHVLNLTAKKHQRLQRDPSCVWHSGCMPSLKFIGQQFLGGGDNTFIPHIPPGEVNAVAGGKVYKHPTPVIKQPLPMAAQVHNPNPNLGGSKMSKCEVIYAEYRGKITRHGMITKFINDAGCTTAGASTYYQTLKKRFGD